MNELPIRAFSTQDDWEQWLDTNHLISDGIWIRFYKKNSDVPSIVYAEALDVALCFGWIDSQTKSYDTESYLQKFTPRRKRSIWSKVNREHIERLISEGRMKPAGIAQVEAAKHDGRWDAAYSSPSTMVIPDDFLTELHKDIKAKAFFETLNKTNTYVIAWRLATAKTSETRLRRMNKILAMLRNGEKFH